MEAQDRYFPTCAATSEHIKGTFPHIVQSIFEIFEPIDFEVCGLREWRGRGGVILNPSDRRLNSSFSSEILPLRTQWRGLCHSLSETSYFRKANY